MTEIAPVEVSLHVPADAADVFGFLTDPARYVQWMGSEAELEPVPGGVYRVRMADGFEAAGRFLARRPPAPGGLQLGIRRRRGGLADQARGRRAGRRGRHAGRAAPGSR